jgi:hypothetical protein
LSVATAEEVLEGLYWFLSFVRGLWVPPMLFVGYAADGAVVWRKIGEWSSQSLGRAAVV